MTRKMILLVRADTGVGDDVAAALRQAGFLVQEASGVREGEKLFSSERHGLVLLLASAPAAGAAELVSGLKGGAPEVPIVAWSDDRGTLDELQGAGAEESFAGPASASHVVSLAARMLDCRSEVAEEEGAGPPLGAC